ncbi:MAG: hypothetical protein ACR2O4_01690, partial [Hyphomicrobiaceae bacterium]
MKLRAIRLKEFRRFADPVAVEGLTGKLDVLAAPNEDGKSTLFEAVRTVISEKYNAGPRTGKMRQIQPYVGGAPLIEVDFDIDGHAYRLRKQFVKRPDAVLTDRDTGRDIARKDDVEDWIADNLTSRLPFGLFWVAQQVSLAPALTEKSPGEQVSALRSVVEAEVGAVAGGEVRDRVRKSVDDEINTFVTSRGRKKNGPYDLAVTNRDRIAGDLEAARKRQADAEQRLARLEELRNERHALLESNEQKALGTAVRQAEDALKNARHANAQLREARQEQETSEHQVAAVTQRLKDFDDRARDHTELTAAQALANKKLETVTAEVADAEKTFKFLTKKQDALNRQLQSLRAAEKVALLLERRTAIADAVARQKNILRDAREATGRIEETMRFLADEAVNAERVQTLQQTMGEVAALQLKAQQQIPKITVRYDKETKARIHADGQVLGEAMVRPITERTDLVIDGVGRMSVDPGDPRGREDDADDLAAHQAQRDELMDHMGVTTLKEAQKRAADREARSSTLLLDKKRLSETAPDGIGKLETALKSQQTKLDALPDADPEKVARPREIISADIAALEPDIAKQATSIEDARQKLQARQG